MIEIDAKPYPYGLTERPPALVIIDMQRDFVEPGGFGSALGNDVTPLSKIIPSIEKLLQVYRRLSLPVIHTREAHKADLSDCPTSKRERGRCSVKIGDQAAMGRLLIDGEPGNNIVAALKPVAGEYDLAKPGKGAFYATPLSDILKAENITHLLFAGVTTEVCVQTSMREANDRGFECLLIEDATESYFPQFKQATLEMITAQGGIVGWTANSEAVISAIEKAYGR
jgi:nicotinamidase-related amidase